MLVQILGNGDGITGVAALRQPRYRLEYQAVVISVQVFGNNDIGHLVPRGLVQHQAAEHRLLGFD